METRSGTGGNLPPVAGHIGPSVVKTRPDLKEMGGYIVRVPRSLDIDMNEDSQRVWVQAMCGVRRLDERAFHQGSCVNLER